jgi:hypothetical protein
MKVHWFMMESSVEFCSESYRFSDTLNPLKPEALLNNIYKFSSYLRENTTLHQNKDQLVNAV